MSITSNEEGLVSELFQRRAERGSLGDDRRAVGGTAGGGMRMNMIPKDGGNIVSGSVFFGGTTATGSRTTSATT